MKAALVGLLLVVATGCLAQNSQQLYGQPANREQVVATWDKLCALEVVPSDIVVSEASGDGYLLRINGSGIECGSLIVRSYAEKLHITFLKLYENAVEGTLCTELSAEILGQIYPASAGVFLNTASTLSQYLGDKAIVQSFSRLSDGMVVHATKLVKGRKLLVLKVFHKPES